MKNKVVAVAVEEDVVAGIIELCVPRDGDVVLQERG